MLLNRHGQVFIGRRKSEAGPEHVDDHHAWQMPQGGIDEGEDPRDAAFRELWEETNVRSATLIAEAPDWFSYDLPDDIISGVGRGVIVVRHRNGSPCGSRARKAKSTSMRPLMVNTGPNSMHGDGLI